MSLAKRFALRYIRGKLKLLSSFSKRKAAEYAFELFVTPQSRNRKELPAVFERSEKLQFHFHGSMIKGYRWHHPSEKKLLILHGFESSVINFERYIQPLVNKGYEVLAFDAPAHGRSGGKRINALDYKNFILEIQRRFGPIHNYITHSFGGLALSLALEQTPHDNSWKIVFIAPATETTTAINNFFRFLKIDEGIREEFDDIITRANNRKPSWYSISRAAEHIKAQVLFLQDRNDELTPLSDVEPIMKKGYTNFRFIITDGLGHRRIYRDHNSWKAIIDFF